jgi:hemoglobin
MAGGCCLAIAAAAALGGGVDLDQGARLSGSASVAFAPPTTEKPRIMTLTETSPPQQTVTAYELLGGEPALRKLVGAFYRIMDAAPEAADIRAMHGPDLGPITELLFEWLSGWLGGPALYSQRKGGPCLVGSHRPYAIGEAERDQWLWCMAHALDEQDIEPRLRRAIDPAFARIADMVRNR